MRWKWLIPTIYIFFLLLPIYWLVNMSLKTNDEILSMFSLWPKDLTFDNYMVIFTDASWYSGYINSMIYVSMNVVISVTFASACRLCLFQVFLCRRQTPFFLAPDQPYGTPSGLCPAIFSALFVDWSL